MKRAAGVGTDTAYWKGSAPMHSNADDGETEDIPWHGLAIIVIVCCSFWLYDRCGLLYRKLIDGCCDVKSK